MSHSLSVLLLLTSLVLGAIVVAEIRSDGIAEKGSQAPVVQPRTTPPPLPTPSYAMPPIEAFSETVTRPLFVESRRPPEPQAETVGEDLAQSRKARIKVDRVIVSAIVIAGDQRLALLRDPVGGKMTRLREGERIAQWSLDQIRADSVVLSSGGETKEVQLWRFEPAPPQPAKKRSSLKKRASTTARGKPRAQPSARQPVKRRFTRRLRPRATREGAEALE